MAEKNLKYARVKSWSIGIKFSYKDYQYLYKYPRNYIPFEGNKLKLIEKKAIDWSNEKEFFIPYGKFQCVDILELEEGFVLSNTFYLHAENYEYWIAENFQHIADVFHYISEELDYQLDEYEYLLDF